jgi:hypothetical protein
VKAGHSSGAHGEVLVPEFRLTLLRVVPGGHPVIVTDQLPGMHAHALPRTVLGSVYVLVVSVGG